MTKQEYLSLYLKEYGEELKKYCVSFDRITEDYISEPIYQKFCFNNTKIAKNALTCHKYIVNENHALSLYFRGYSYEDCQKSYKGQLKNPLNKIFKQYWIDKHNFCEDYALKFSKQFFETGTHANLPFSNLVKEYWIYRGYSEEEAKLKVSEYQSMHGKNWGAQAGTEKYKSKCSCNILYWLSKGYSEEEAKLKLSERQKTFSKEKCIEKYGEEEGLRIWTERQSKWQHTLKLKSKEEYAIINYKRSTIFNFLLTQIYDNNIEETIKHYNVFLFAKCLKKIYTNSFNIGRSSASKEACNFFSTIINPIFEKFNIEYVTTKINEPLNEIFILDKDYERCYFYDFSSKELGIIIEYNGTKFHPKNLEDDWVCPFNSISKEEKYYYDQRKMEIAKQNGYVNYFSIWSDYTEEELTNLLTSIYEIIKNKNR